MAKFIVGLTGGIASGKTLVSHYFEQLGTPTIDTDHIAKQLVQKGSPAYNNIVQHFGKSVIDLDGSLNRKHIRELISYHPEEKTWLENLLHPLIREEAQTQAQAHSAPVCLIAIPLLKQRSDYPYLNRILAVVASTTFQRQRLMQRDQVNASQADAFLRLQPPISHYRDLADDIIENNGQREQLEQEVAVLNDFYQEQV